MILKQALYISRDLFQLDLFVIKDKENELKSSAKRLTKHSAITKKALTVFGFPYFKDVQMFYPPPNKVILLI